jgi:hypothetical protein
VDDAEDEDAEIEKVDVDEMKRLVEWNDAGGV